MAEPDADKLVMMETFMEDLKEEAD